MNNTNRLCFLGSALMLGIIGGYSLAKYSNLVIFIVAVAVWAMLVLISGNVTIYRKALDST